MPAMSWRTSSAWNTFRGKTTSNNRRTCDTVSAGAFFFQPDLQVPEEEMGQHTGEHVMMPAGIFAHLIMIHAQFGFRFLKTLFNGPADSAEPHQETQGRTERSVTEIVPVPRMGAERPLDKQPHRRRGLLLLAQPDPFAGERVRDRAFGAFRYGPTIPERRGNRVGQRGHCARRGVGHRDALGALFAFISRRVRRGGQWLEPTPCVRWRRHERDSAYTGLAGRPKVRAVAVEAIRHNVLERQYPCLVERLDHRGRQSGFALPRDLVRQLTFRPPGLVGVGEPRLWQKQPFVDEGIAPPRGIGGKHADLTVLDFAQGAAVLARDTNRIGPLFHEP